TLNIGLRYELMMGPVFPNPDQQTVSRYMLPMINGGQEGFVFPKDGSDCGCNQDWNNFAPRLGLGFRLNNKTVIRSGGGIYYGEPDNVGEAARFATGPPKAGEVALG